MVNKIISISTDSMNYLKNEIKLDQYLIIVFFLEKWGSSVISERVLRHKDLDIQRNFIRNLLIQGLKAAPKKSGLD